MTNPLSILIVDDSVENLRLLTNILSENSLVCRPVTDGKNALRSARKLPPDLILLDVRMPEMDGIELCARLKSDPALKDTPIIFISGLNETEDKLRAFDAGGVDYITKPFQEREVKARVRAQLQLTVQKRQLRQNFEQLQKLEKLRDDLVHMVLHDVQNPLMRIRGNLQMVETFEKAHLNSNAKRYLNEAFTATGQCIDMVNEVLTVSKMENDSIVLDLQATDLAVLARQIIDSMRILFGEKQVRFDAPPTLPRVRIDSVIIGRVIQNLLGNAIKFSPDQAQVEVGLKENAEHLILSVSDCGPGIPADQCEWIFEKYNQAHSAEKRRGIGLGLTFCKLAVEAHGGKIQVSSKPGAGSTFSLFLRKDT